MKEDQKRMLEETLFQKARLEEMFEANIARSGKQVATTIRLAQDILYTAGLPKILNFFPKGSPEDAKFERVYRAISQDMALLAIGAAFGFETETSPATLESFLKEISDGVEIRCEGALSIMRKGEI